MDNFREIPDRPGDFAEALKSLLGAGANALRRLWTKGSTLSFKEKVGWDFQDYVEQAREKV
ncbi:TPA: hypothetical protein EYP26_01140 [Candidatus Bathyarchaeota archaeon]|nr:hypothetical protein [Candidatus Bathyarchaeota archaeon]